MKITKWHNSCNTDPSAPFFLQNVYCLMVKVWCKFDQIWLNTFKVTEQRRENDDGMTERQNDGQAENNTAYPKHQEEIPQNRNNHMGDLRTATIN